MPHRRGGPCCMADPNSSMLQVPQSGPHLPFYKNPSSLLNPSPTNTKQTMCSSKSKKLHHGDGGTGAQINGRLVLQPTCNQVPNQNSPAKAPLSPSNLKSPPVPPPKRPNDPNTLNSSTDKSKKHINNSAMVYSSSQIVEAPGTIAAARREHVAVMQEQRKMKIAHYGRSKSARYGEANKLLHLDSSAAATIGRQEKRCSFITPNSDPTYVTYHDEEWGVPAHDDCLLFELLVLSGAQVGSDWTSILKKRQDLREAFCGFDAQVVAKFTEKKITSLSAQYGIETSQVRGIVDNSIRIVEVKREFGSFDKYLWKFVNEKPISPQYKSSHKMAVKTSKSESISKDMVRRGFRQVGPTVIYSFMQAAGLTNDHLITCPRHLQCMALASHRPAVAPAL